MMFFLLIFSFASSLTYSVNIIQKPIYKVVQLRKYGFASGGCFYLEIKSTDYSKIRCYLLKNNEITLFKKELSHKKRDDECNDIFNYEYIFFPNESAVSWKVNVKDSDVWTPFVVLCDFKKNEINEKINISIKVICSNIGSMLDTRYIYIDQLYMIVTTFYSLLLIIWIFNGFIHPKFHILLHSFFVASAFLKVFSTFISAIKYYQMNFQEISFIFDIFVHVSKIASSSLLMVTNCFAMMGWCIYRPSIQFEEILSISFLSLFFFVFLNYSILEMFDEFSYLFNSFCIVLLLMIFHIFYINYKQISFNDEMLNTIFPNSPLTRAKIKVLLDYGGNIMFLILISVIFLIIFALKTVHLGFRVFISEALQTSVLLCDMSFFLIKDSSYFREDVNFASEGVDDVNETENTSDVNNHATANSHNNVGEKKEQKSANANFSLVLFIDPVANDFVVVSK